MIEIIPFNTNLFNTFDIKKHKITKYTYINDLDLVSKLLCVELPIKNRRIFLRNIFDFLMYIDIQIHQLDSTILPISVDILIEYFTRDRYKKYINILENLNIMTKVPYEDGSFYKAPLEKKDGIYIDNKIKGGVCSQFRIHNEYLNKKDLAIIVLEDDRSKKLFENEIENLDKRYINTIKKLEIDIPKAIEAEIRYFYEKKLSIRTLRIRISRIFSTNRKRFIKKGDKVDRIYHSFTNVSRISRKYLNINMKDIDIVNCQPLLLVAELENNNMMYDEQYKSDCECGNFYERFIDINKPTNTSDEEWRVPTKVNIYKSIFFGFNLQSKHNKRFKELYPLTWESLHQISKSNIHLASRLQNLESDLFNNLIPKKSKYYFTLFDAIYFDNILDRSELEKTIIDFFNQYKIKVKIK